MCCGRDRRFRGGDDSFSIAGSGRGRRSMPLRCFLRTERCDVDAILGRVPFVTVSRPKSGRGGMPLRARLLSERRRAIAPPIILFGSDTRSSPRSGQVIIRHPGGRSPFHLCLHLDSAFSPRSPSRRRRRRSSLSLSSTRPSGGG